MQKLNDIQLPPDEKNSLLNGNIESNYHNNMNPTKNNQINNNNNLKIEVNESNSKIISNDEDVNFNINTTNNKVNEILVIITILHQIINILII